MSIGPHVGDAADGGRDLVFVSYSHDDAQWVQRFTVLLNPLVRRKRLRLWADTDIRVGDEWHPDILRAIERSSVALLLVSADFLYSDFIMDQELPALFAHGVRLAPVLVGECLWDQVPKLAEAQWLHDPGREGALNLVADHPGLRDRRLREVCERLIALAPPGQGDLVAAAPVVTSTPPVVAVHAGSGRAELSGVPAPPPGYLKREELAAVIEAVMAVGGGAVGLTGAVSAVGLHGQGGIGKSVLAAAVASEERIRRCFPDGVYWVTAGEKADVLAIQLELLARLGARDRAPRTPAEALVHLREVLADQRVLLVVDDVWSDAAAQAFRVTGPSGQVLYTSRDPQVLAAVGARPYQVDVLSPDMAQALAATILGIPVATLPAAADRAFAEVGRVALAVALLAAAVLGGRSWDEVDGDLRRDAGIFGDHPFAAAFKAMQIAVAGLPTELANALLSLAVFPADTQIPLAAITRYWAHTRDRSADQTASDLDALAAANVLRLDDTAVGFHDLQHDYLLLHAPTLVLLHDRLLDAYRALLPDHHRDQWWRLPVGEPYIWDHLVAHLRGAGERQVLAATVTDPAYLVQRIAAGFQQAAEADLASAAAALPPHDLIVWWRRWLPRNAHLLTLAEDIDHKDRAAALAPTMLAWLTVGEVLPTGVDLGHLRTLLPAPHLQVRWGLTPPDTALVRVLTGHTNFVQAVAWSADGTELSIAIGGGEVQVRDPVTGDHLRTLIGLTDSVREMAWCPDGNRLVWTSDDGEMRLYDSATGELYATTGYNSRVQAMAWSADGTELASADESGEVRVWNPAAGEYLSTLTGHTGSVQAMAWSADGIRLACADWDGKVRVWNPAAGEYLSTLTGHTGSVQAMAWSADGIRLACADWDGKVRVWNPATGEQLSTLTGHTDRVTAVAWSPDGTRLAGNTEDEVRVWNPDTGHQFSIPELSTLTGNTDEGQVVERSPDGIRLDGDNNAEMMEVAFLDSALSDLASETGERKVRAVAWSPDGALLVSVGHGEMGIPMWNPAVQRRIYRIGPAGEFRAMAWSPDGVRLAGFVYPEIGGDNSEIGVGVLSRFTGKLLSTLPGHIGTVQAVAWSADGTRLASAIGDEVRVWNPATGQQLFTLIGHTDEVLAVAWSPDGTRLASGDRDGRIYIFDLDRPDHTIYLRVGPLICLQWSSAGIAIGGPHGLAVLDLTDR